MLEMAKSACPTGRRDLGRRIMDRAARNFVDARSVPTGSVIETEVCIVGAGAAGITLAREFTHSGFRVILLESGGAKPEQATQDLYAGSDIGRPYDIFAASRLRYFGGTTNCWGRVWCDMPNSLDFEMREGVPYSGWPFSLSYLEPWYRRSNSVLMVMHLPIGASHRAIFLSRSAARISFAKFCSKPPLRDLALNTGPNC